MAELYDVKQCPVFKEAGGFFLIVPYGENIPDYPTKGKVGHHFANDITYSRNGSSSTTYIVAIADGVVIDNRKWVEGFCNSPAAGNNVVIKHGNGWVSRYYHLKHDTIPLSIGDGVKIKKGDLLGKMGKTGQAYGAHLHFQLEDENGNTVDPLPYLLGEKVIGENAETEVYRVSLAETFSSKDEAKATADALNTLGIKAEIESI